MNMLYVRVIVFLLALLPLLLLIWDGVYQQLSVNPIEDITQRTGQWALRFLLLTLAITPLRQLTGWRGIIKLRRLLGLYAFFYATLHFITYIWLEQYFAWQDIIEDIVKRPYITVGFAAFILLLPLAFTSTKSMMKRLGKHWKPLHQLIYICATFALLHYFWSIKADYRQPLYYLAILLILLGYRIYQRNH